MSPRVPLSNVDTIGLVQRNARNGYEISVGQAENRTAFFEIWAVVLEGGEWKRQPFSARFPAKLLRQFALALNDAADLIDARRAGAAGS